MEKGHHTHALHGTRLVLQGLGLLCLLLELHLKVLAALQGALQLVAALGALQTQHHLLRGLGLLVEDGLGLTTKTLLLAVVTTLTCESKCNVKQKVICITTPDRFVPGNCCCACAKSSVCTAPGTNELLSSVDEKNCFCHKP